MTTPSQLATMATFLAHLRTTGRGIPVNAAEALLLIASGVDHIAELQQAMPDTTGEPLPPATTARLVGLLRGRARYAAGKWIESPFSLVSVRPHPHRRGQQLLLSEQGQQLINAFFGEQESRRPDCERSEQGTPGKSAFDQQGTPGKSAMQE
jgi:hypothetical protein